MMTLRWTQEAGAEMRSVFLCNTNRAAATIDDFVALKHHNDVIAVRSLSGFLYHITPKSA